MILILDIKKSSKAHQSGTVKVPSGPKQRSKRDQVSDFWEFFVALIDHAAFSHILGAGWGAQGVRQITEGEVPAYVFLHIWVQR